MPERHQGADDEHPTGAYVKMRAEPDAPEVTGDQILELGIEWRLVGVGAVDMDRAHCLAAHRHAAFVVLLVVHLFALATSRRRSRAARRCRPAPARRWQYARLPARRAWTQECGRAGTRPPRPWCRDRAGQR